MPKPTISPTAVPSPLPIAQHVDNIVLEWQPAKFVLIHLDCLKKMSRYTRGSERDREAGGIFLGNYRGLHTEITAITEPLPLDRRGRFVFDRNDPGHHQAARSAWTRSGRTTTFTGEWHTHPEDVPFPSSVDLGTWAELVKKSVDPLTFIILGWRSNWYGVGHGGRIYPARPVS